MSNLQQRQLQFEVNSFVGEAGLLDTGHLSSTIPLVAQSPNASQVPVVSAGLLSPLGGLGLVVLLPIAALAAYVALRPSFLVPRTNEAYVIRGGKSTRVVLDGGTLLWGTRRTTRVVLNEVEVKVEKGGNDAVRTQDSLKANITVVFHVGVAKDEESIKLASSRLAREEVVGVDQIKEAVNARADDAIRGAAKTMDLDNIDREKPKFEGAVRSSIAADLALIGLAVLSVSVSEITEADNYNPADFLDAQGIGKRTAEIETSKRMTHHLQQETELAVRRKELETEGQRLILEKTAADAQAEHKEAVQRRLAQVDATVESERALQKAVAEEANAQSQRRILAAQQEAIQAKKAVMLAEEQLQTAKLTEHAQCDKAVALLKAAQDAEVKKAAVIAEAQAEAQAQLAAANAGVQVAEAQAKALQISAEAKKAAALAEAEGILALVNAQNSASPTAILAQFLERHGELVLDRLPDILESLSPKEGVLGSPTIISTGLGQGDMANMLLNASAAGVVKYLLANDGLGTLLTNFIGGVHRQVSSEADAAPCVIEIQSPGEIPTEGESQTHQDSEVFPNGQAAHLACA